MHLLSTAGEVTCHIITVTTHHTNTALLERGIQISLNLSIYSYEVPPNVGGTHPLEKRGALEGALSQVLREKPEHNRDVANSSSCSTLSLHLPPLYFPDFSRKSQVNFCGILFILAFQNESLNDPLTAVLWTPGVLAHPSLYIMTAT